MLDVESLAIYPYNAPIIPAFIFRPYDVRIAPNFLPAVEQYDSKEYAVVERAVNTLDRRYTFHV